MLMALAPAASFRNTIMFMVQLPSPLMAALDCFLTAATMAASEPYPVPNSASLTKIRPFSELQASAAARPGPSQAAAARIVAASSGVRRLFMAGPLLDPGIAHARAPV